jgi:hypothetical protein
MVSRTWKTALQLGRLGGLLTLLLAVSSAANADAAAAPEFERVADVLVRRCVECHAAHETSGGLNLTTHDAAMKGGDSGPVVAIGKPDDSYLMSRIHDGEMPPPLKGKPQPLPAGEAELIEQWIASGANWPDGRVLDVYERTTDVRGGRDFWSLQPVVRPPVPTVQHPKSMANAVDAFVLSKVEAAGFEPAPQADRATLIRRIYFDLIGLPPTAEEIAAFERDPDPEVYEKLVEKLLESPHFGERWARRWLDLARFAETSGYERDQEKTGAWRYRDWVVNAANTDMPYNRFIFEQLAGDEIPDRTESSVIATGFLRLGTWNDEPNDPEEYKYDRLEDMVHATCTAFIGLTVKCARCHDHKFDPILQSDYYKVAAAFWAGPIESRERELLGGPSKDELGYDVLGWTDLTATPAALHLLKKGDPKHPLDEVESGSLSMVSTLKRADTPPPEGSKTSQRRLQLAKWITDPAHPLTARVLVNRLWQAHFGEGIVRSPDNFGFTGDRPTHPELLDWLADEFVKSGWSTKHIHRLIVKSRTYRQSSLHPNAIAIEKTDAGNRLWWRFERHRLDAEQLRDRMLAASGAIDLRMGGPSFKPTVSADALEGLSMKGNAWKPSPPEEQNRRSLYIYSKRGLLSPLMTTFDFVDTTLPCGRREISTVAPQALALMNNQFVHEQSDHLAERIAKSAGLDDDAQIQAAWQATLCRSPTVVEFTAARTHLVAQAKRFADLPAASPPMHGQIVEQGLALRLRASDGIEADDAGRVIRWRDLSGFEHDALQAEADRRPEVVPNVMNGQPVVRCDGQRRFLNLAGQVLTSQQFTVFAVVSDAGDKGHRTLFSNWNGGAGNSVTSVFFGLTTDSAVRLSDDFAGVGRVTNSKQPFLLTGVANEYGAVLFQNRAELAKKATPLAPRNLTTAYVVGQQGNIDGEYWNGDLAELLVYDRALSDEERLAVSQSLAERYGLWDEPTVNPKSPQELALASLCHVLMNCNEFVYVD